MKRNLVSCQVPFWGDVGSDAQFVRLRTRNVGSLCAGLRGDRRGRGADLLVLRRDHEPDGERPIDHGRNFLAVKIPLEAEFLARPKWDEATALDPAATHLCHGP